MGCNPERTIRGRPPTGPTRSNATHGHVRNVIIRDYLRNHEVLWSDRLRKCYFRRTPPDASGTGRETPDSFGVSAFH